ncbi:MAG: AMP-binding enzyme [Labedaea sp.]
MPNLLKRSELHAPPAVALAEHVIGDVLRRAARFGPTEPLLRTVTPAEEHVWTAAGLLSDAQRVAAGLLVRRRKDMIKTGGENVASEEVEDAVVSHPSVVRVAVVGAPSERWCELVIDFVVPARPAALDGRHRPAQ